MQTNPGWESARKLVGRSHQTIDPLKPHLPEGPPGEHYDIRTVHVGGAFGRGAFRDLARTRQGQSKGQGDRRRRGGGALQLRKRQNREAKRAALIRRIDARRARWKWKLNGARALAAVPTGDRSRETGAVARGQATPAGGVISLTYYHSVSYSYPKGEF